jgi:thiamine pyrophosphokinase
MVESSFFQRLKKTQEIICRDVESIALIANGAIHDYPFISSLIADYDRCIAIDGGLLHCHQMGITPSLFIGDQDSTPPETIKLYQDVPSEIFPPEKDQSDLELAIEIANAPHIHKIGIFGAMEMRTDHALANLHVMRRLPKKIIIETEKETIFSLNGSHRLECRKNQIVSLIPMSSASGVTTKGLKWELSGAILNKDFFSLSNVCLGSEIEISIEQGDLICCLLR